MRKIVFVLIVSLMALALVGCSINFPSFPGRSGGTALATTPAPLEPGWTPLSAGGAMPLPDIADVVPLITPSVVSIQTEAIAYDVFLRPYPEQGAGTGIVIDPNGYILTNNHVVEGATKVTVTLNDGRSFEAVQVRRDPQTDVAVVKIDATGLQSGKLGDSKKLRVGDWVIAVGNALALEGGPTVTKGIVSYIGRSIAEDSGAVLYDLLQTDAAINPGNSGGPLVNMAGEVVGINTAIAGSAQNIGFAISITPAIPIIQALIDKGFISRPYLGISMQPVNAAVAGRYGLSVNKGVLVTVVSRGSPAEKAGLKPGDVITEFGGTEVATDKALRQLIFSHNIGDDVVIVVIRGSSQMTLHATLVESPPAQ